MKFPRHVRVFRGPLEVAPFASVFFLLVLFALLGSLVYTPGLRLQSSLELPAADNLPGAAGPSVAVAVDASGQLYFENQIITEQSLSNRLNAVVVKTPQPLTLIVQADKSVTEATLVRLVLLARGAGVQDLLLATLPPVVSGPGK